VFTEHNTRDVPARSLRRPGRSVVFENSGEIRAGTSRSIPFVFLLMAGMTSWRPGWDGPQLLHAVDATASGLQTAEDDAQASPPGTPLPTTLNWNRLPTALQEIWRDGMDVLDEACKEHTHGFKGETSRDVGELSGNPVGELSGNLEPRRIVELPGRRAPRRRRDGRAGARGGFCCAPAHARVAPPCLDAAAARLVLLASYLAPSARVADVVGGRVGAASPLAGPCLRRIQRRGERNARHHRKPQGSRAAAREAAEAPVHFGAWPSHQEKTITA